MNKVILFNPRSANSKHRIPNSILQVGASIEGKYDFVFVDGNREIDPWTTIKQYLATGEFKFFGSTVMPGPQLKQAIPISKKVRENFPEISIIWGGYFASNQFEVVLNSGFVDVVINGPGDNAFPSLLNAIINEQPYDEIKNLIFKNPQGDFIKTGKDNLPDLDALPNLPYDKLNSLYSIDEYLGKSFLGQSTIAYHSSFGCPFTCSFCAVVPIFNARWKGKSALGVYEDVLYLKKTYGADSIEFHDNNFFTSRKRTVEFSRLIEKDNMTWWGEGRIDTLDKYSDDELRLMKRAGCQMIFFGAETGNDEVLKKMDKGGTQTAEQILQFAGRLGEIGIIPEYSFVLGLPGNSDEEVMDQINQDIEFIKKIKKINPKTEIIIYVYSPVPSEGSELFDMISKAGFKFPTHLEDWLDAAWENFDLRKNPLTPWLKPYMIDRIRDFETVLNAKYPTATDFKVKGIKRLFLKTAGGMRYATGLYKYPYEIKLMHKVWKYRQPEIEGMYKE